MFWSVNPRKAAGPDGIGCVYLHLQPLSVHLHCPKCFKSSIIVLIPKKSPVSSLSDYRPVAITSIVMKCIERLVLKYIKRSCPLGLDQHQFAYRANRTTGDINTTPHSVLTHLQQPGSYARMLFLDCSSAFNTIIPGRMVNKLHSLGVSNHTCRWIKDFLTERPQSVRMGFHYSSELALSTWVPQGCVLSPLLYILYTHDCTPIHDSNIVIKFADDTTVLGLIHNNDKSAYRDEIQKLTAYSLLGAQITT